VTLGTFGVSTASSKDQDSDTPGGAKHEER
jgi:hypothetical protein